MQNLIEKIIEIFKVRINEFSKAVCLNAAAGLIVNESFKNFQTAFEKSKNHLSSGKVSII